MRRALQFTRAVLLAALGWVLILPAAPVSQPLAFNHAIHGSVTCAGCHTGALAGQRAGLPTAGACTRCHAASPGSVAGPQWERMLADDAPFWNPVTTVPDHVMFSHRRHTIAAGLACESCHADIGRRARPPARAPVRLVMDTCIACHRGEGASEDCAGCHR